jgi:hypothetical protein
LRKEELYERLLGSIDDFLAAADGGIALLDEPYKNDPVRFVREIIGAEPDAYQAAILADLAEHPAVAVRSGHGVGKTAVESWAMLWWLATRPFCKVPCTAPTEHQLFDLLWAEAAKWLRRSRLKDRIEWTATRIYVKGYQEDWFAVARTSNRPDNMQGFHAEHLLFIIDEASGVPDEIMAVVDGALTNEGAKVLMCGNPTRRTGYFFNAFHKDRAFWRCHHINSESSPRVSPEYPKRMAQKWGRDSDIYRVRVLGEFPRAEADTFIPLEKVEAAVRRTVPRGQPVEIGVDVARFGDDETVIAPRFGQCVPYLKVFRKQDTMATVGEVLVEAKAIGAVRIKIDDTGVGGGVTDRLREVIAQEGLGIEVVPVNFGGPGDEYYDNATGVMWGHLRELLDEIQLPANEDLVGQLASRKWKMTSRGRIRLESKDEMKKRGLPSPDRADAVVLAFAPVEARDPVMLW